MSISRITTVLLMTMTVLWAVPVFAESPMASLKKPIEEITKILQHSRTLTADEKQAQRDKIFEITRKTFDFVEMSKRSLARNWKNFTPQQRKDFSEVFSDHLNNTYMDKIQNEYQDETVEFLSEEKLSEDKALVKSIIKRRTITVPVDYSVLLSDNVWRVYDVNIEGVSLIKNYRTQFDEILVKETPEQLIERLRKKTGITGIN
ncbi:MAG: ABC transporter substrate-binding protein [Desulfatirhabdiaceae bacterium]